MRRLSLHKRVHQTAGASSAIVHGSLSNNMLGSYRHNGKENGNYRDYRDHTFECLRLHLTVRFHLRLCELQVPIEGKLSVGSTSQAQSALCCPSSRRWECPWPRVESLYVELCSSAGHLRQHDAWTRLRLMKVCHTCTEVLRRRGLDDSRVAKISLCHPAPQIDSKRQEYRVPAIWLKPAFGQAGRARAP